MTIIGHVTGRGFAHATSLSKWFRLEILFAHSHHHTRNLRKILGNCSEACHTCGSVEQRYITMKLWNIIHIISYHPDIADGCARMRAPGSWATDLIGTKISAKRGLVRNSRLCGFILLAKAGGTATGSSILATNILMDQDKIHPTALHTARACRRTKKQS